MVTLNLTPELHAFTYECLLAAQGIKAGEARLYSNIMSKFELIATPIAEPPYFKINDNIKLDLEDAEHKLMSSIIKTIEFTAAGARIAAKSFDSLHINA